MLDRHIWGTVDRISPEAPVPVVDVKKETMVPGGASNVANNIVSLNSKADVCGIIGDDEYGMLLVDKLEKLGANVSGIMVDVNRPTTVKTRVIAHSQQVVRIDREHKEDISKRVEDKIIKHIKKIKSSVNGVIIEDYGKGVITRSLVKKVVKIFKKHKIPIAVDPKENHFDLYKGVSIITPNQKEAENMLKTKFKSEEDVILGGKKIVDKLKLKALLLTRGKEGMLLFHDREVYRIPTVAKEEFDVTGAGDTVIAVLTAMLTAGLNYKKAAYISNVAAGIVVEKPGVVPIDFKELKERLKNEKPNIEKIS
ncbi:MAG: D-glycero-beta-D-manno-heptose-7-phosphate kinase [Candidatus Mcinerneyibacterium aminivorans]|uniref:D-glycero-beta-D-manno-heptose-7-phosphate kinase n=1 Tax=Candidatus Mcinerneyibacterium aminivorans TaxID=2703815 RepID=A0A5D0MD90_9BACT|nr:MAG: D-glycero-beta-D-manno-heptose-7-phosphate kinase [Candidatus Mcinerneyibacterium aminivorans]